MSKFATVTLLLMLTGCTSFKTTVWQRHSDHRLYPNQPCAKTKGLPVKLKVPSHVEVTISESFFIQASKRQPDSQESTELKAAKHEVEVARRTALVSTMNANKKANQLAQNPSDPMLVESAKKAREAAKEAADHLEGAKNSLDKIEKTEAASDTPPAECREIEVCIEGQPIRHFDVATRVIYTDKVFTVDFRRPAGGVLNLSAINMDDEQYFRQIKAAYEEQTLEQINGAIADISSGITGQSVGGMSATINGARVSGLATDDRVVAVSRFDISDPCWEHQLNCFVDQHVTAHYTNCSYQN